VLLTGASGQVGSELIRTLRPLGDVAALGREECDLARPESLAAVVRSVRPQVIVNAAAYTAVDRAEEEEELAVRINGTSVGILAEEARRADALFVHYSTDYVFDGNKADPYTEEDTPCPINAYGRSKLAGETAVCQVGGAFVILRTSWVYAARGRNFVRTILRLAREREELRVISDQIGAPTWARNIAGGTAEIARTGMRRRREDRFVSGVVHMTAAGATSWYALSRAILEIAHGNGLLPAQCAPRVHSIASDAYPLPAKRPKNSCLATQRLAERFGVVLPDWKEALALCIQEMAREGDS
jgi:dTDP-4-dehydrorhamnose reductase